MYSLDLRNLAIRFDLTKFRSYRKTAEHLGLQKSSIHRWVNSSPIVKRKQRTRKITNSILKYIENTLQKCPFTTLRELQWRVKKEFNQHLSTAGLHLSIKRIGFTRKENIQKENINKKSFKEFIDNLPKTHATHILMVNVSFHHSTEVLEIVRDKGYNILFTPPYTPIFNPIEHVFSYMKAEVRNLNVINIAAIEKIIHKYVKKSMTTIFAHCWKQ